MNLNLLFYYFCLQFRGFIERCIRSIFNQTYNIEIVVIDDCSTDSTNLILNNLSKVSNVVTIIRNKLNLGLTKS